MSWFTNSYMHGATITHGDYLAAQELLNMTVSVPVNDSIAQLIEHDKINATRSISIASQTLGAIETQNKYAAEQVGLSKKLVEQTEVSNELLQHQNIELELQTTKLSEVNFNLGELNEEVRNLGALLDWRLAKITDMIEGMGTSLQQLVEIAKTPSQTWAAEQFDIARDAYSNSLYEESFTYIGNAINGNGAQTGYLLDHRYHFLKARLLFGDGDPRTHKFVNFEQAEQSFLKAERYSRLGSDKAMSLCGAALCAGNLGNNSVAMRHLKNAKKADAEHTETRYLLSKLHFESGSNDIAEKELRAAYDLDIIYIKKSVEDAAIQTFQARRDKVILQLHHDFVNNIEGKISFESTQYGRAIKALEKLKMINDSSVSDTSKQLLANSQYYQTLKPSEMGIYTAYDFLIDFGDNVEKRKNWTRTAMSQDKNQTVKALNIKTKIVSDISRTPLPELVDKKEMKNSLMSDDEVFWGLGQLAVFLMLLFMFAPMFDDYLGQKFYPDGSSGGFGNDGGYIIASILSKIGAFIIAIPLSYLIRKIAIYLVSTVRAKNIADKFNKISDVATQENSSKLDSAGQSVIQLKETIKQQLAALNKVSDMLNT